MSFYFASQLYFLLVNCSFYFRSYYSIRFINIFIYSGLDLELVKKMCSKGILVKLGFVWLKGWKSGRIENEKVIEKWEDKSILVFPHMCLVGRMEK